jgi:hypothetical protein
VIVGLLSVHNTAYGTAARRFRRERG